MVKSWSSPSATPADREPSPYPTGPVLRRKQKGGNGEKGEKREAGRNFPPSANGGGRPKRAVEIYMASSTTSYPDRGEFPPLHFLTGTVVGSSSSSIRKSLILSNCTWWKARTKTKQRQY